MSSLSFSLVLQTPRQHGGHRGRPDNLPVPAGLGEGPRDRRFVRVESAESEAVGCGLRVRQTPAKWRPTVGGENPPLQAHLRKHQYTSSE